MGHRCLSFASLALLRGLQAPLKLSQSRALLESTRAGIQWSMVSARRGVSFVQSSVQFNSQNGLARVWRHAVYAKGVS